MAVSGPTDRAYIKKRMPLRSSPALRKKGSGEGPEKRRSRYSSKVTEAAKERAKALEEPPRSAFASVTSSDVRKGASRRISRARRQVCIIVGRPKEVERAPTQKPTDDVDAPTADRSPGNQEKKKDHDRGTNARPSEGGEDDVRT